MLELPRLTIIRQRRLAQALEASRQDAAFVKTLAPPVVTALAAVVAAGTEIDVDHVLPPLLVDTTTDAVFAAFESYLGAIVRGMSDKVIAPLPADRAAKKAAASLLLERVYPDGVAFLARAMPLQYDAMAKVVDLLRKDAGCIAAVKELGAEFFVDHMEAHLAPYGRAVKTTDDRDLEAAGGVFHAAYVALVVQIEANHGADEAIKKVLWNPYQTELDDQREEGRKSRAKTKKKKAAAAKPKTP
jgi:hypothetical protein